MTRIRYQMILATALLIGSGGACAQESVLFSFDYFHGAYPKGNLLVDAKGNLFGTTFLSGPNGGGTVFELSPIAGGGWTDQVLYTFPSISGAGDGAFPTGTLVWDGKGNLYGTTQGGGLETGYQNQYTGTVFELSPTAGSPWTEKVIYRFGSSTGDGSNPTGNLVFDSQGNLYGTTTYGGATSDGTVFQLTPSPAGSWTEKVLFSFGATTSSGRYPEAGLAIDSYGNLYGTTYSGGLYSGGTLFELVSQRNGTWTENVLHDFNSPEVAGDGRAPTATLILDEKGNLYGTTSNGGTGGYGTVFELSPGAGGTWVEKVFEFGMFPASGIIPMAGLTMDSQGNLYGTASYVLPYCTGTVFKLTPEPDGSWAEKVLHDFFVSGPPGSYSADGYCPNGGVIFDSKGNLYGTTLYGGGTYNSGTVFEIGAATAATLPVGTMTTLAAFPNSNLVAGEPIMLTATVTPASGAAIPIGTVTFADPAGGSFTLPLIAGKAMYSGRVPTAGAYSVYASYSGGAGFVESSSAIVTRTVEAPSKKWRIISLPPGSLHL